MTGREYINSLSNKELASWVIYEAPKIGKMYTESLGGLIDFFEKRYISQKEMEEMIKNIYDNPELLKESE